MVGCPEEGSIHLSRLGLSAKPARARASSASQRLVQHCVNRLQEAARAFVKEFAQLPWKLGPSRMNMSVYICVRKSSQADLQCEEAVGGNFEREGFRHEDATI